MSNIMPEIPLRTSSVRSSKNLTNKRKAESSEDLRAERARIDCHLHKIRKQLKPHGSFDFAYWSIRSNIAEEQARKIRLNRKVSEMDFYEKCEGSEGAWESTQEALDYIEQEKWTVLDGELCRRQAERLKVEPGNMLALSRRAFIQLFTSSKRGLNITTTGSGARDADLQQTFRRQLIKASNSSHPTLQNIWCAVTRSWVVANDAVAAHIFSYRHGQEIMDAIFGRENLDDAELFSPHNGVMMAKGAEKKFDRGFFVIVPDVPDTASEEQIKAWHIIKPQQYKVRVINRLGHLMNTNILASGARTWNDLDGERLEFRSDHRPRARYLYFHYCTTMLRRSWTAPKATNYLKDELGKLFWGTPGRYMPTSQLRAFVEEMGHEYETLMQGSISEETEKAQDENTIDISLAAANKTIQLSYSPKVSYYEDSSDEEECEVDSSDEDEYEEG